MKALNAVFAVAGFAGCTSSATTAGDTTSVCSEISRAPTAPSWSGTIFTIVMENKGQADIFGNKHAPYINSLANKYAVAKGYHDSMVHPSSPNYLWMVAGENFGVLDDSEPLSHHIDSRSHLADQIETQGLTWKAYEESMGAPCGLTANYPYEPKHDPFVYFNDINGWDGTTFQPSARCTSHVVDYKELHKDLASGNVPKFAFITPNMLDDMHDGSVADGDAWLAAEVPKILASDAYKNGGVLFLTWDEGNNGGDDPPMIVISPNAKPAFVSTAAYDASSYLMTVETLLGVDALPCNSNALTTTQPMADLFSLPIDVTVN